ncbi:amidohydrolase family protein [Streptomyces erythrochromogenes]|uniref:amidohydrolase family protein n=1 Tax=Streptomyces erythrochromogenes TaxID=285574 RepID=UPI00386F51B1|nr:amidohydrolase [Streptomyces erythrochromogenes]
MSTTDWHAHLWPRAYLDFLEAHGQGPFHQRGVPWGGDSPAMLRLRLRQMDDCGIDRQVLNSATVYPGLSSPEDDARAARLANESLAAVAGPAPHRFAFLGVLPLAGVAASVRELGHLMDRLGALGVVLPASFRGASVLGPRYAPLHEELDDRRATVLYHPTGRSTGPSVSDPAALAWSAGAIAEQTTVVLDWLTAGMSERFPRIRPIVARAGGACFLLDPATVRDVAGSTLCFDSHTHGSGAALGLAVDHVGPARLFLGSDYPFVRDAHLHTAVRGFHEATGR